MVGATVLLLVVIASAAGSVRPFDGRKNQWSLEPQPQSRGPGDKAAGQGGELGEWNYFWTALLYLVIAVIVLVLLRLIFQVVTTPREKKGRVQQQTPTKAERLAEALDRGLRAVERGTPSDGVIACWVGLEDAAAAAGVPRDEAETPAEFTLRVLAVDGVSAPDLTTLADLYREARYSSHPSSEEARTEARSALTRLRIELAVSPSWLRRPTR